jgi:hypothetical protein
MTEKIGNRFQGLPPLQHPRGKGVPEDMRTLVWIVHTGSIQPLVDHL